MSENGLEIALEAPFPALQPTNYTKQPPEAGNNHHNRNFPSGKLIFLGIKPECP